VNAMKKILIILICFCLLFPINSVLTSDWPLISQPVWQEFELEVREGECIAQKWRAIDHQLDVYKFSLYVKGGEFEGVGVAGISEPNQQDPQKKPFYEHDKWLCSVDKSLSEMEGWVYYDVDCSVTAGQEYYLMFKVLENQAPGDANATVHGSRSNPYWYGSIWFYERGVGWREEDPMKDIAFEIWGTLIVAPQVQTLDAEHIEDRSAELWGQIIDDGGQPEGCEVRFELEDAYGNPIETSDWGGSYYTDDKFYEEVHNLNWGTKYFFRAGARNDNTPGEGVWGDWISFTMDVDDRIPEHHAILIAPWFTPRPPHPDDYEWEPAFLLLERVLKDGGFQSKNIHTLYDEDTRFQNIIDTLTELNDDPWDTTLVVIGTHGAPGTFQVHGDGMVSYENLSKYGLDYLKSAGVCVMIEACDSESAIDYLKKDGRIIWTSSSDLAISQFAMALDEFADYTEYGDKNGTVSVEEAYNHIENYEQGIHVHFQDDYPYEANNDDELSITRQNWNDGRVDQLNGICCSYFGQYKYVNQWLKEGVILKNKTAQEFYPTDQYDKLIKVKTEVKKTDTLPTHNLLVSIRNETLESDDIGSKQISPDDITYTGRIGSITYGEKYTTIKFDDSINIEHGMPSIPYFIVYSPTGTDAPFCKYEIHCSLYGTDYPYGNSYHCYYADGENDEWIEDADRDIRFVTYGLNSTNMPPYTPKRPSNDTRFGNPGVYYNFTITTTDIDGDNLYYCMDWGDDALEDWIGPYDSGEIVEVSHMWEGSEGGQKFVKVKAKDLDGKQSGWSDVWPIYIGINHPPNRPDIDGPLFVAAGVPTKFTFTTVDPDGDDIYLWINWGDGATEEWIGPYPSGEEVERWHTYTQKWRIRIIWARAKDVYGEVGDWAFKIVFVHGFFNQGCPAGTQITMDPAGPAETKSIEDIMVGDIVASYDPINHILTSAEVIHVYEFTEAPPEERFIFNGNLEVTTKHTLYINQTEWMEANDTRLGYYMLQNIPGSPITIPVSIISKEPSTGPAGPIYDLAIQPIHGEAIGYWANGILVGGFE